MIGQVRLLAGTAMVVAGHCLAVVGNLSGPWVGGLLINGRAAFFVSSQSGRSPQA